MTISRKLRIRLLALAVGGAALLVPATISSGTVKANDACADGRCCPEIGSLCETDDPLLNHYESSKACGSVEL